VRWHVVEAATEAGADATSGDSDGQMGLAGPADQHGIALLGDEAAAGEVLAEPRNARCEIALLDSANFRRHGESGELSARRKERH
jgi:hypothetical protein